jgi:hypothetical protein
MKHIKDLEEIIGAEILDIYTDFHDSDNGREIYGDIILATTHGVFKFEYDGDYGNILVKLD